jgi:hypothetical protein
MGLRTDDLATALRGFAGFAATRLAAAYFATFADFLDVLPAIVFTPPANTKAQLPASSREYNTRWTHEHGFAHISEYHVGEMLGNLLGSDSTISS